MAVTTSAPAEYPRTEYPTGRTARAGLRRPGRLECTDARMLYRNDRLWGYVGEPAHAYEDGAEPVAPDAERVACAFGPPA
jgi:hypothetical protein